MDKIKAFAKTKLGMIIVTFFVAGLIGVAGVVGCGPCVDVLKPLLPVEETAL
jgi:hypothetical protein